jgi:hypothetical protein
MKESCLIYNEDLLNLFKTHLYSDDKIMTFNKNEDLKNFKFVGINCFEEILNTSDFYSF